MKGLISALAGGMAAAVGIAAAWEIKRGSGFRKQAIGRAARSAAEAARAIAAIDINSATREQFMGLPGVSEEAAERIIENRPYRNRLDLLSRLIVGEDLYNAIKHRLHVDGAQDPVKVAS